MNKQSGPATPSPSLAAQCSACGQKLKARSDLAGKKVKCRQCGQGVLIPETNPDALAPHTSMGGLTILKNRGALASVLILAVVAGACSWLMWPRDKYWYLNTTLGNEFVPEVQESGFYQQEFSKAGEPYRWTNGKGRLVVPIDRRKPPTGLVVELFIVRPAQVKTAWVRIAANNRELTNQQILLEKGEGVSATFPARLLDLTGIDLGDELVLDIISDTFIPNPGQRTLGVVVRGVEVRHVTPAPE